MLLYKLLVKGNLKRVRKKVPEGQDIEHNITCIM